MTKIKLLINTLGVFALCIACGSIAQAQADQDLGVGSRR
jgi:hypothetical protein